MIIKHNLMNSYKNLTDQEKYDRVLANLHIFNAHENKCIAEIKSYLPFGVQNTPILLSKKVQLETFYKLCAPAFQSIVWEEQINYAVAYPIACIAAFKIPYENIAAVDVKIATWAESGGTRLVPIKSSLSKERIKETMRNSHALIIPEFQAELQDELFNIFHEFIEENKDYPVLALGNSAIVLMSKLLKCEELVKKTRFDLKFHNYEMCVFASHEDALFRDLDLKVRLEIQNKARMLSSSIQLPVQLFKEIKSEQTELIGVGKGRVDQWSVVAARKNLVHFGFIDPRPNASHPENIHFNHKLIINFMEEVWKRQKKVEEKSLELGQYKVTLKQDRYFYNVDMKLPKI